MPDWLNYQELIASIYRDLTPDAVVTHDDRIFGYKSGAERQIDVSIRTSIAGRGILIILQAKDLKRRQSGCAAGQILDALTSPWNYAYKQAFKIVHFQRRLGPKDFATATN